MLATIQEIRNYQRFGFDCKLKKSIGEMQNVTRKYRVPILKIEIAKE